MKELIQLLQIWKDQGAIKPDGLLKDADIQKLIDKMAIESQESDSLPCVRLSLPSQNEIDEQIDGYAFRVPYDGSNNFYDEVALKHYKAGIEWLLKKIKSNEA